MGGPDGWLRGRTVCGGAFGARVGLSKRCGQCAVPAAGEDDAEEETSCGVERLDNGRLVLGCVHWTDALRRD